MPLLGGQSALDKRHQDWKVWLEPLRRRPISGVKQVPGGEVGSRNEQRGVIRTQSTLLGIRKDLFHKDANYWGHCGGGAFGQ